MISLFLLSLAAISSTPQKPFQNSEQIKSHVTTVTSVCKNLVQEQLKTNTSFSFEKFVLENKLSPTEQIQLLVECLIYVHGVEFGYEIAKEKPVIVASS